MLSSSHIMCARDECGRSRVMEGDRVQGSIRHVVRGRGCGKDHMNKLSNDTCMTQVHINVVPVSSPVPYQQDFLGLKIVICVPIILVRVPGCFVNASGF